MPSYTQYKRQMAVLDDDNDIESWITVHGNHIPIKKGQSKEDAVHAFVQRKFENKEWNLENSKTGEKYYANKKTGYFEKESGKKTTNKAEKKRETYTTAEGFEFYKDTNEPVKKGGYTLADKNGNIILQANFVDNTKSYLERVEKAEKKSIKEIFSQLSAGEEETLTHLQDLHGLSDKQITEIVNSGEYDVKQVIQKLKEAENNEEVLHHLLDLTDQTSVETRVRKAREFETKTGISPEDYEAYEQVRESGAYNMFDYGAVSRETGLPKDVIRKIQENYTEARKVYGEE